MTSVEELYAEGLTKFRNRDYSTARQYFDQALCLEPNKVEILVSRGRLPTYEQGIADCLAALAIDPTYADAWALRGYLHWRLENPNEAIRCCSEALRLDSKQSWALLTRIRVQVQVRNWPNCFKDLQQLLWLLVSLVKSK